MVPERRDHDQFPQSHRRLACDLAAGRTGGWQRKHRRARQRPIPRWRTFADELYVSRNTVKTHMRNLYAKLNTHRRAEAVERARDLGLLAPTAQSFLRPGRLRAFGPGG